MGLAAPPYLGLPEKFKSWRPGQVRAITDLLSYPSRFAIQIVPTGVGKSIIYTAAAMKRLEKTVMLTSTKGLQDQLMRDFNVIGLVEVRGRNNYPCIRGDGPTCEDGLCRFGLECEFKGGGCPYYDALRTAKQARYVVTNYAMWLTAGEFLSEGVERLVMDEAHSAPDHLHDYLKVEVDLNLFNDVLERMADPGTTEDSWKGWIVKTSTAVKALLKQGLLNLDIDLKRLRQLVRIGRVLDNLYRILDSPLVIEQLKPGLYEINPLELVPYAEPYLFRGIPAVHMTSATVTAHTAKMLGATADPMEYPSAFPVANRPVIWIPTTRVDRKMDYGAELVWLARINQIIKGRLDRKGIVHAVSYSRSKRIIQANRYERYAISHNSANAALKVQIFKHRTPPAFLVSPCVTTGWDFPGQECEWQIIVKVPFPDSTRLISQKRQELDPLLPYHHAWQTIAQAAGRGVRSAEDRCETFILDDHFKWLWASYKHLAPKWFQASISRQYCVPPAAPKCEV